MCTGIVKKAWDSGVDSTADAGENLVNSVNDITADLIKLPDLGEIHTALTDFATDTFGEQQTWSQGGNLFGLDTTPPNGRDKIDNGGTGGGTPDPSDPVVGGSKDFQNQNITDNEIKRRRALSRLRRGFLSTIKTTPGGLASRPSLSIPALSAGLKSTLGGR